jgi:hypothetical protein
VNEAVPIPIVEALLIAEHDCNRLHTRLGLEMGSIRIRALVDRRDLVDRSQFWHVVHDVSEMP